MSVSIDYTGGVFQANKAKSVGTITAGTGTYNLAVASYDSVSFSVAGQETSPQDLFFKADGTKVYVIGTTGDDVNEYDLSTAWDVSSASYLQNFSVSAQDAAPGALVFSPDGVSMYFVGYTNDNLYQYDLSTAWDVTSASYVRSFSVAAQETNPRGLSFKDDGTKFYINGPSGDKVSEYILSSAWDISTASYSQNFSISSQAPFSSALFFAPDGASFYVISSSVAYKYDVSTAWDISTSSYSSTSFSLTSQDTSVTGVFFKSDGSKMYIVGSTTDTIYQYSTGTATSLDISSGTYFNYTPSANTTFTFANAPASGTAAGFALAVTGANVTSGYDIANASYDSVSFSVTGQDNTSPLGLAFNNNGTKMYMLGGLADTIYQYSLSTAFDVSTASYDSVSFSVQTQDTNSLNLTFNNNGTKMYTVGGTNDSVYQYSLSTAFDLSTASYDSVSFSTSSQDTVPYDVAFNSSGTKMYIVGYNNDTLYQYSLSTAYDLSTASYDSVSFSVTTQETDPTDFAINPDGTEIYVVGFANDTVYKYTLSTAYDLSTASYSNVSFSVASQENIPRSVTFNSSGSKMYILGSQNKSVYQYSTQGTSTATFSYPASVEWPSGTAPTGPAIGQTDVLVFYTDDGGTTYQGFRAGDAMA